jgi:hypothetical protein
MSRRLLLSWMMPLLFAGCFHGHGSRLPTYPASGSVFFGGQPAAGAIVQLSSLDDPKLIGLCPHAVVGQDGSFQLTTYRTDDGAPAGTYALTLRWPSPPPPDREEGPDRFAGLYADPEKPLCQVEIKPGNNLLHRIELKPD